MSNRYMAVYYPDNIEEDRIDVTPYLTGGISIDVTRNKIATISMKIEYRQLLLICDSRSMTLDELLVEWFSTIVISQDGQKIITGVLDMFPEFTSSDIDAEITLEFQDIGLGLSQLVPVESTQTLSGHLNDVLLGQFRGGLSKASSGRNGFPLSVGSHVDVLPVVTWVVSSDMKLGDFLTQRCDNTDGSGYYDINFTPDGQLEIWSRFGVDVSNDIVFQIGNRYSNVEGFDFPAWNDYYTDVLLRGSGTLVSRAHNSASRNRHYYACLMSQDSSISTQAVLDQAATKLLKYCASPVATPTVTINATRLGLNIRQHAYGGDLWVGDTVKIVPSGIYSHYPMPEGNLFRINTMSITIDQNFSTTVKMTMVDPTGGDVDVDS